MRLTIITVCQRKGGVGKSSSTLNLAYALAERGYRVLVVDLDDQQNTTSSISSREEYGLTVSDLLLKEEVRLEEVIVRTLWENVWVLPSSPLLSGVVKHLDSEVGGHLVLKEKLSQANGFDYCLIDNSPALNILNINSFCASRYLFIPLASHFFSLSGLGQTLTAYQKVKNRLNPDLSLLAMAFVIHDKRNTLAGEIVERVAKQYPAYLCSTLIGTNIKIEEAQVKKQSILTYAPEDRGASQYRELASELLLRLKPEEGAEGEEVHG
jgi:chromosome partitioning protein